MSEENNDFNEPADQPLTLEQDVIKNGLIQLITQNKDPMKDRQLLTWVLGLGGETPEMMQLQSFMLENEEYHKTQKERVDTLEERWKKLIQVMKYGSVLVAPLLGAQALDVLRIIFAF